jgi:hypothetical protein
MTGGWMRATAPAGNAEYEGITQWSGDLGVGVRAAEAGQSENRDDAATGSKQLRDAFTAHLEPEDIPLNRRGIAGVITKLEASKIGHLVRKVRA